MHKNVIRLTFFSLQRKPKWRASMANYRFEFVQFGTQHLLVAIIHPSDNAIQQYIIKFLS